MTNVELTLNVSNVGRCSLESKKERVMRFELTTSTLARLRSTPELHPQSAGFSSERNLMWSDPGVFQDKI